MKPLVIMTFLLRLFIAATVMTPSLRIDSDVMFVLIGVNFIIASIDSMIFNLRR